MSREIALKSRGKQEMKTQLRAGFSIDSVSPGYCEQVEGQNPWAGGSGCPAEQALPAGVFD